MSHICLLETGSVHKAKVVYLFSPYNFYSTKLARLLSSDFQLRSFLQPSNSIDKLYHRINPPIKLSLSDLGEKIVFVENENSSKIT